MIKIDKVAIIGGTGMMGQWFSAFFSKQGMDVVIYGRDYAKSKGIASGVGVRAAMSTAEALRDADLVVISVTPSSFEGVVKQLAPHISKGQKVIDITSVKCFPVKAMHKYIKNALVLGTHPMFGPKREPKGQNFILTPTNKKEQEFAAELASYLDSKGFNTMMMSPQEHDEMISMIISLTHFIGFVTADTWRSIRIERVAKKGSTSFRALQSFVDTIVDSNPELYSYLQIAVPKASSIEKIFVQKSKEWSRLARSKNQKELQERMASLKDYFSGIK